MMKAAPFLNAMSLRRLDQTRLFLSECNSSGVSFRVSPHNEPATAVDVGIFYSAGHHGGRTPDAIMTLAMGLKRVTFRTHLFYRAVGLLTLLADQPNWLRRLQDIDPDMPEQEVWPTFRLDPRNVFQRDLRPVTAGDFITFQAGEYIHFSVDTHGEVIVEAEAKQLAVIAFRFAAEQASRELRVDEKFGRYARRAIAPPRA